MAEVPGISEFCTKFMKFIENHDFLCDSRRLLEFANVICSSSHGNRGASRRDTRESRRIEENMSKEERIEEKSRRMGRESRKTFSNPPDLLLGALFFTKTNFHFFKNNR